MFVVRVGCIFAEIHIPYCISFLIVLLIDEPWHGMVVSLAGVVFSLPTQVTHVHLLISAQIL